MPFYLKVEGNDGDVSSAHGGGMVVVMADGSVRTISR